MRYYDLVLTDSKGTIKRQITSHPNGQHDPGALNIAFDLLNYNYASPMGASTISVEGIPLQDLTQAQQFTGLTLTLSGGMKKGLPLANPAQSGVLTIGQVWQSFGNWQGTDMTLDFVILASAYTFEYPGNIILNCKAGMKLGDALQQTLSVAYPGKKIDINISSNLVYSHDLPGYYKTLSQLATVIKALTKDSPTGPVNITFRKGQLVVYDQSITVKPVALNFTDFVGQPTWIDQNIIQIKLVMRADLQVGSVITMPQGLQNYPGIVTTESKALPSQIKYQSTFNGQFQINAMRHVGNFRSSDGGQWVTIINAYPCLK